MKIIKLAGAISEIWQVFVRDSSSTTGGGLTGLAYNSSGLTAYYHRDTDTTVTAISLVTMTVGTFTSGGFKEIDATNMPGWYQFCPPNAAIASGAKSCAIHLKGATNMAPLPIEVQLTAVNVDSATAFVTSVALSAAYDAAKTAAQAGDAMALTSGERTSTADALLNRNLATGTDSGGRTVRNALRPNVNKVDVPNGIVYKEDDSTTAFTFTTTTDAAAQPITVVDPA